MANVDWKEQEAETKIFLETALANLKQAMNYPIWAYTREYQLGKLDVVKAILSAAVEEMG